MNAPTKLRDFAASEATLDERLRYIDIFFESAKEARTQLVAEGKVNRFKPFEDEFDRPEVKAQGQLQADRASLLIAQAVFDEGLNPAVISVEKARSAYAALVAEVAV